MAFEIELDTFSGRPNPRWVLDAGEAVEFLDVARSGRLPAVPLSVHSGKLGYRGMIVRSTGRDVERLSSHGLPSQFRVSREMAAGTPEAEQWLLELSQGEASPAVRSHAAGTVREAEDTDPSDPGTTSGARAACTEKYTRWNNFDYWNGATRYDNNCYNYASNCRTNTFAQPGKGTGRMWTELSVSNVRAACLRDGYKGQCNGLNLHIVLVIWAGEDFHFYRKNVDGNGESRWCHKPGGGLARNTDNVGNLIPNPFRCDRSPYDDWGGHLFGPGSSRRTIA